METVMQKNQSILMQDNIIDTIQTLLNKYHAEAAILFGPYARLEADPLSDIDVIIIGGDTFDKTDVFCLADDLHRATGKEVDVYELCEIEQGGEFYQTILREGVRIAS